MKAPDKGSFTLDHFRQCAAIAESYNQCLKRHNLMPKRCRKDQIEYMKCRMDHGLMKKQDFKALGFIQETTWENQVKQKEYLYERMNRQKQRARAKARQFIGKVRKEGKQT